MDHRLNIALYNTQADQWENFERVVKQVRALSLCLETESWEELEAALKTGELGAVLVNLDENVEQGKDIVQRIGRTVPDLSIIGVSKQTDPSMIISAMRAGCSQFVCAPVDPEDFRNAVARILATRMVTPHQSKRVCIVGASGGVGATAITCNLAMELAALTHRTCALVDLHLEYGDAANSFDCEPKYSLADLCGGASSIERPMVESAIHMLPCDVALLGRPPKISDARLVTPEGVEQALRIVESMYPYVLVDLPRTFSFLTAVAIDGVELVLIIAQLSIPSVRNASRVFDQLLELGADRKQIELVLNRCRAEHQRVTPDDVEQHFRRPVFAMIPNDYRRVTAALDFGHPIVTNSPNSPARLAIQELARMITKDRRSGDESMPGQAHRGLFKRWWGGAKAEAKAPRA